MKYPTVILISLFIFLASCGPSAEEKAAMEKCKQDEIALERSIREKLKNTFDASFPGRNRNLARILGDTLQIRGRCGWWNILSYKILSSRKSNLIINIETGDTLFKGTVSKYKDLYYLNEQINDTSFRIFALKITDSLICGFQNYFQYYQIDTAVEHGYYPKLVKYFDKNKNIIRLHPDKKELKRLFTSILDNTEPFEIVRTKAISTTIDTLDLATPSDSENFEILSKAYPNPAKNFINIELQKKNDVKFRLTDINGKTVLEGQFTNIANKINLSGMTDGIYFLTLLNIADKQNETIKIIKAK
jgi:hypothetical protein